MAIQDSINGAMASIGASAFAMSNIEGQQIAKNKEAIGQLEAEKAYNEEIDLFEEKNEDKLKESQEINKALDNDVNELDRLQMMEDSFDDKQAWMKAMQEQQKKVDMKRWQKEYMDEHMNKIRNEAIRLDIKGNLLEKNSDLIGNRARTHLGKLTGEPLAKKYGGK